METNKNTAPIVADKDCNAASLDLWTKNYHRYLAITCFCLYDAIGDPTVADAILDRIVHSAHQIELTGIA